MKKIIFVFAVLWMAGIGSAMAQSINGTWKANQAFEEQFELNEDGSDIDLLLVFNGNNMDIKFFVKTEDAEVGVVIFSYTIPGTFKKNGKTYVPTFNREKAVFKVEEFVSSDPEMKEMMKDPETKKMVLTMLESSAKDGSEKDLKEAQIITEMFEEFEVVSVTAQKLELKFGGEVTYGFDRQ